MSLAVPTTPATRISVRVLLFATYADLVGRERVDLELEAPATVAQVVRRLREEVPGGARLPERPLAAVNQVHARPETPIADGDELALLPPLAGG
jgi:molybdopterin converting factor small subunit